MHIRCKVRKLDMLVCEAEKAIVSLTYVLIKRCLRLPLMGIRETWEKFFLSTEYGIGYKYRYDRRPMEYMFFFDKHSVF